MSNVLMLLTCLMAGLQLRRGGRLPEGSHGVINALIVPVSLAPPGLRSVGLQLRLDALRADARAAVRRR